MEAFEQSDQENKNINSKNNNNYEKDEVIGDADSNPSDLSDGSDAR